MDCLIRRYLLTLLPILFCAAILHAKDVSTAQMKLTSSAFNHSGSIPAAYSCDGSDKSPPLAIAGVPREAKSLALIMEDPDAPAGTWVHWVLWNIDPATKQIVKGSTPRGAEQGVNSWQRKNYGGPCPPSGRHRYYFRLYALSERLTLPGSGTKKELDRAMEGKILAQAELLGLYSHK